MNFESEVAFEQAIRTSLQAKLLNYPTYSIMQNKKVADILICYNSEDSPKLFFLEVKYHKSTHGRLPIGQANGRGFQPELLTTQPIYFNNHLRWVYGYQGSPTFILIDSNTIVNQYLQGDLIGNKHNGAKKSIFKHTPSYTYDSLIDEIVNWLLSSV